MFSEEPQQLFVDMNHTEIFELCENSLQQQCLDCNSSTEIWMIIAVAERSWKYTRSPTTTQKANNDKTSILGLVTNKVSSRRAKHSQSQRQIMFFDARCFTTALLLNDIMTQLHELNDFRKPNIWFFVWMLMAPQTSSTATRICRCIWTMPESERCSHGGNNKLRYRYFQQKKNNSRDQKTSISMPIVGWR